MGGVGKLLLRLETRLGGGGNELEGRSRVEEGWEEEV